VLLMALIRDTDDEGWSRMRGRDGISQAVIARRSQRSVARTKVLLRELRQRRVVEAEKEGNSSGIENAYRIRPQREWLPVSVVARKERQKVRTLRMRRREGGIVWLEIPGKGVAEIAGQPEVRLGAAGQRPAVTVTGADVSSLRIPEQAQVDFAPSVLFDPTPLLASRLLRGESAQTVPGLPATRVASSNRNQNAPGLPATQVPPGPGRRYEEQTLNMFRDGLLRVIWPANRRLMTAEERRLLARMAHEGGSAVEGAEFFCSKGFRAMACLHTAPPGEEKSSPKRSLRLDEGPTGLWDRVLRRIERSVNPHSFSTWFRPTREAGTLDRKIIVAVPSSMFVRRLASSYGEVIRAAAKDIGEPKAEFIFSSDEYELLEPPAEKRTA
jgi:DnaA N-terminal domain